MTDMNFCVIKGRVVRDIDATEFRAATADGKAAWLSFSVAVNRSVKGADGSWSDEATFLPVKAFGRTAEFFRPRLHKAVPVVVCGALKQENWTDKSGAKRSTLVLLADKMEVVALPPKAEGQSPQAAEASYTATTTGAGFANFPEDIPF